MAKNLTAEQVIHKAIKAEKVPYKYALIRDITKPFGFRLLQDAANLVRTLEKYNIPIEDLIWYVSQTREILKKKTRFNAIQEAMCAGDRKLDFKQTHPCPDCELPMFQFEVNTTKCNRIDSEPNLRRQWICPKCNIEEYE